MILDVQRPKNHSYSTSVIQLSIILVTSVGISFRAVSKLFIQLHLCLNIDLGTPSHTSILNWTKKQGVSNFRDAVFYNDAKWVLIADESVQFGNKKLLFISAVPAIRCSECKPLSYTDLTPLVLQVSASWKSADIASAISQHIDLEQIAYCISDNGNNLTGAFKLLGCKHISDINHKFSWIVQSVFGNESCFEHYTKSLSSLRAKWSVSKIARIVPPNQRIMSRFMNLKPLFEWGVKMIHLLENSNELTEKELEELSFLHSCRSFVFDTYQILIRLNEIQKLFKNEGFNDKNAQQALSLFSEVKSNNWLKIKELLLVYFADLSSKAKGETICCSSDILESCFGKYKEIVKGNKSVGISDLCLCIATMLGKNDRAKTKQTMESVSIEQIKDWKKKNTSKTLFAEKQNMNKKIERNWIFKK